MRLVTLESPYRGASRLETGRNIAYARMCLSDSLAKGESPIASHLLYTQPGVLDDRVPEQRAKGIAAGLAWLARADASVVYVDHGISEGMAQGIKAAEIAAVPVEYRRLFGE
jgi:hypothetical protein